MLSYDQQLKTLLQHLRKNMTDADKISPHPSLPKRGTFTEEGDYGFPLGSQEEFFGDSSDLWVFGIHFFKRLSWYYDFNYCRSVSLKVY
jgi:hypothetical protein